MNIENRRYIKLPTSDKALEALCKVALTKHSAHTLLIKLCTAADKTETGLHIVYTDKAEIMKWMDCTSENVRRCMNVLIEQKLIAVEHDKAHGMMWIEVKFLDL